MYQQGEQVLYSGHGVCTVIGIESMKFGKTWGKYYCLQPLEQPDSRYYVSVGNEAARARLSPLMTREELLALLHSDQVRQNNWIQDEGQRKLRYRELISSSDRAAILNMIYCLHKHKEAQTLAGKKFRQCDSGFLHDAQKLLNSEFSAVFGLESDQVPGFIKEELNKG